MTLLNQRLRPLGSKLLLLNLLKLLKRLSPLERQAAAPTAPKAAPWDPYGIHAPTTGKNEPQLGASAEIVSAPEAVRFCSPRPQALRLAQAPFVMA